MLRISRDPAASGQDEVPIRLEGEVMGRWVEELRRACDASASASTRDGHGGTVRLVLDVADVRFIDADGLTLLRELIARRVVLKNRSLFVTEQLRQAHDGDR
jgi:hypothetical protein